MGWFSASPAPTTAPPKRVSADGTPEAPSRNDRQHCWEARDAYFACLDRHDILDALKNEEGAKKNCGGESQKFEMNCAQTWVGPFIRISTRSTTSPISPISTVPTTLPPSPYIYYIA